jgi:SAM-dependent methyltransferase
MSDDLAHQYRDSSKLMARMALHMKYGQAGSMIDLPRVLDLPTGARVLEVGCGPGRFWERAADRVPADLDILLTDLSPGMVEEAVQRVRSVGRWRAVRGEPADVCALPFDDGAFDVVLAMHMLYHATDPQVAIGEIARVLRPGGMAVASTNGLDNLSALMALGYAALGGSPVDRGAAAFSLEVGEPMMRHWFDRVEVRRSTDVLRVTDPADVVAYLLSYPPGDDAGPEARARLDAEVRNAFSAGGGVFCVTRDAGYILGRGPRRG